MTKEQVKTILERVLTWPTERQEDVARIVLSIEEQDNSPYHLTEQQAAEVRRRQAARAATIPADEVFQRYRPKGE
jgi:hypothetical protein